MRETIQNYPVKISGRNQSKRIILIAAVINVLDQSLWQLQLLRDRRSV